MRLLRSKPAAAMLVATTIAVPLLIGAADATGSTHAGKVPAAQHSKASQHSNAARHAKALRRLNAAQHAGQAGPAHHAKATTVQTRKGRQRKARTVKSKSWRLAFPRAHKALAAGDPADTISDFKFTPGTLTIHVGDTVTWTNDGPTDHTATANDGSFNTGTLKKGQSASHTFSKAGTFAYICAIHPFMKGTIVVEASTASTTTPSTTSPGGNSGSSGSTGSSGSSGSGGSNGSSGSGSSGSGTSGSTSTSSASTGSTNTSNDSTTSASTLPETGLDLVASVLVGLALMAGGLGLRTRVRRVTDADSSD
jgi:plastocyanin